MDIIGTIKENGEWEVWYSLGSKEVCVETPNGIKTQSYILTHEPRFGYDVQDYNNIQEIALKLFDENKLNKKQSPIQPMS